MSDLGQVTFRLDLDFGSFRDVQRHRNGVCRMPLLSAGRGVADFHPWYLGELDPRHAEEARQLVNEQAAEIAGVDARPEDKQYLAAMGSLVPCRLTYALPAAVYVMELRSGKMIHPTLRRAVQAMIDDFRRAHPSVRLHVDESPSDWDVRRGRQTIVER